VTRDGRTLESRPVALGYDDGTYTTLITILTNSLGQLVDSNQVIYRDAFEGVSADLHYETSEKGA
jgi:hypothetical protein